jgi:hypothetical protein
MWISQSKEVDFQVADNENMRFRNKVFMLNLTELKRKIIGHDYSRNQDGEIIKLKSMLEMFTWGFGNRDKVRCEVSLMEDKE